MGSFNHYLIENRWTLRFTERIENLQKNYLARLKQWHLPRTTCLTYLVDLPNLT